MNIPCRFSFVSVFSAKADQNGNLKYGAQLLIPKDGPDTPALLSQINAEVQKAIQRGNEKGKNTAQLAKSNAAGHAFAARLRVAQLQKCQRHIDRTQARRTGRDPAFHVLVKVVNDRLGLAGGFDIQSAQGWLTPSVFLILLFYFLV